MYSANDRHLGIFQYGRKASNAGNNAQLAQLQARIAELERENRDLKKQLSNSKSDMNAYKQQAERAKMDANELKHQLNAREYQAPPPSPRRGRGRTAGRPPSRHSAQHSGGGRPTHRLGDPPPLGKPQSPRGATSGRFPRPGQLSAILPRASDGAAVALSAPPRLSALGTRLGAGRLPRVLVPRSPPAPFMHPASGPSGTASPRRLLWPPVFAAPQRN